MLESLLKKSTTWRTMGKFGSSTLPKNGLRISGRTQPGSHRNNEDRFFILPCLREAPSTADVENNSFCLNELSYCVVIDGHGGETCAEFLKTTLHHHIIKCAVNARCDSLYDMSFIIPDAFKACNDEFIYQYPNDRSGACCVVLLSTMSESLVAWVGDCRAVQRKDNITIRLTSDHRIDTNPEEKARVLNSGGYVMDDRVFGVLSPTRSFGDADVKNKEPNGEAIITCEPEIETAIDMYKLTANKWAFVILGSDGVFDFCSSTQCCDMVEQWLHKSEGDVDYACAKLVKHCQSIRENGDDITVVICLWPTIHSQITPHSEGSRSTFSL